MHNTFIKDNNKYPIKYHMYNLYMEQTWEMDGKRMEECGPKIKI